MHHRAGDVATFGAVNGEMDARSNLAEVIALLTCAHIVEDQLGLPNTTRWYLASDSQAALETPQVQAWRQSGKLIVNQPDAGRVHLAAAGVLRLAGGAQKSSESSDPAPRPTPVIAAAGSLAGVADAWLDFLALSRASAAILSSSAFGLSAAQIGGLSQTYFSQGCVRMDLSI
eukprot:gnl/TRDRNA2_/TRDRNA2_127791_c1_seq1.p1 gnl/TRDRNA2_/TRDRNA2_127791_c1~~gnl/TRDRNA2_/TRDRNA2_127791_c1_seq1.p1  ORF type:complete len:180 (-),score=22.48 gnl/TRDRNA2_/TRDRNA2_127791_c1_seq1:172-690(-)